MQKITITPAHIIQFLKNSSQIKQAEHKLWLAVINNAVIEYDLNEQSYLDRIESACKGNNINKIIGLQSRLSTAKINKQKSIDFFESQHFVSVCHVLELNSDWAKKIIYSVGHEVAYPTDLDNQLSTTFALLR